MTGQPPLRPPALGASITPHGLPANLGYAFLSELGSKTASAAIVLLVARGLGPGPAGLYTLGTTLLFIGSRVALAGLDQLFTRDVSVDRVRAGNYLATMLLVRLGFSVVVAIALDGVLLLAGAWLVPARRVLFAFVSLIVLENLAETCRSAFIALERSSLAMAAAWFTAILKVSGVAFVILTSGDLAQVALVLMAASAVSALATLFMAGRKVAGQGFRASRRYGGQIIRKGFPFWLMGVGNILENQIDILILPFFVSEVQLGYYGAAVGVILAVLIINTSVRLAIYPHVVRVYVEARGEVSEFYARSLRVLLALSVPIGVGLSIVSGEVIRLVYGAEFSAAALPLAILALTPLFIIPGNLDGRLLLASHNETAAAVVNMGALAANIALCLVLVPALGISGAAIARVVAILVFVAINHALVQRGLARTSLLQAAWRPVLASGGMALAVIAARPLGFLASIATGILSYAILAFVLRVVRLADLRQVFAPSPTGR